jgi:hypothetical protein
VTALVIEVLQRYSRLKQRMIDERFGGLDEGLVSRDRRAIREKIKTEPKIRKWFQDLANDLNGWNVAQRWNGWNGPWY